MIISANVQNIFQEVSHAHPICGTGYRTGYLYRKAIAARVEEIGAELTRRLGDKRPVLVCVLKGASFFYIDLCRCMNCAIDMDFISVSSYGAGAQSTGVVRLIKDLDNNITGRRRNRRRHHRLGSYHALSQGTAFGEKARVHHDCLLPRQGDLPRQEPQDRHLRL